MLFMFDSMLRLSHNPAKSTSGSVDISDDEDSGTNIFTSAKHQTYSYSQVLPIEQSVEAVYVRSTEKGPSIWTQGCDLKRFSRSLHPALRQNAHFLQPFVHD